MLISSCSRSTPAHFFGRVTLDPRRSTAMFALLAALGVLAAGCTAPAPSGDVTPTPVATTAATAGQADQLIKFDALDPSSAELRKKEQEATLPSFKVFHDFGFTDRLADSQITFRNQIVDDAGRDYKLVHYDHGSGLSAADVDGDGRIDLYFLTQLGKNQLWRNLGGGRFEDVTEKAGVALEDAISVSAAFADVDNDGDQDLFVTTVRHGNHLFRNDGHGVFKNVAKESGVEFSGHSSGAAFFDYDNDAKLDLLVTNIGNYTTEKTGRNGYYVGRSNAFLGHLDPMLSEFSILYHNVGGGRFEDVTEKAGLVYEGWIGDVAVADVNEDGRPDIYLANMQGDDHYFENVDGTKFVEKTSAYFPKTSWGAMGIKFFDWNNDGRMDLFITDMHSDMVLEVDKKGEKAKVKIPFPIASLQDTDNNLFGNSFYQNQGGTTFEEVSDRIGLESYWPWGTSVGDLNADGWQDVLVTAGMNYPWRYHPLSLLLNNQGERFLGSEFLLGVEPRAGGKTMTPWFELDCDGPLAQHSKCKGKSGKVTVMGPIGSRSSVFLDLDGDGDLDIVTNDFNSEPQVLISDLAEKHPIHFLEVKLTGKASNRDGFGAKVVVHAGTSAYTQVHDGNSGYISHSNMPLYFGLGEAVKADKVEVRWPSGGSQVVTDAIPVNGLLSVVEQ